MNPTRLKTRFLRAFLLYTLDMVTAIAGWVYGFGLPIQNVWILIGLCLLLRFFWHSIAIVFMADDARRIAETVAAEKDLHYDVHP